MSDETRLAIPQLDALLGTKLRVPPDGFVRVVDYMGGDSSIVQAARISYGRGTKTQREDRGLIRYLMRHRHTSPFEMCEIKLHIRLPMDTWRQWVRHRTANVNEYSTRYSLPIDSMAVTSPDLWRKQAERNKQGSEGRLAIDIGSRLSERERELHLFAKEVYEERIEQGVAREQARKDLPLSTYTEVYWKIDLHNLLHFLTLRLTPVAQLEIRRYAQIINDEIVRKWVPMTWEAFRDYRMEGVALSREDATAIAKLAGAAGFAFTTDLVKAQELGINDSEQRELLEKLRLLGLYRDETSD